MKKIRKMLKPGGEVFFTLGAKERGLTKGEVCPVNFVVHSLIFI